MCMAMPLKTNWGCRKQVFITMPYYTHWKRQWIASGGGDREIDCFSYQLFTDASQCIEEAFKSDVWIPKLTQPPHPDIVKQLEESEWGEDIRVYDDHLMELYVCKMKYNPPSLDKYKCRHCGVNLSTGDVYEKMLKLYDGNEKKAMESAKSYGWTETHRIHFTEEAIVQCEQTRTQWKECKYCKQRDPLSRPVPQ